MSRNQANEATAGDSQNVAMHYQRVVGDAMEELEALAKFIRDAKEILGRLPDRLLIHVKSVGRKMDSIFVDGAFGVHGGHEIPERREVAAEDFQRR